MLATVRPARAASTLAVCLLLSAALLLLLLSCGAGVSAQTATVFVDSPNPAYLAMDSAGNLYASAVDDNSIIKLNSQLRVVARFTIAAGPDYLIEPLGVAVVGTSLYAVDIAANHLAQFDTTTGALISVVDLKPFGLADPIALAAAADDKSLYVVDTSADPVHQLSLNGTLLQTFNTSGFLPNTFDNARSLSVDATTGDLYVACYEVSPSFYLTTAEIFELSPAGDLVRVINITTYNGFPAVPEGVAVAAGGSVLFIVDADNLQLVKLSADGTILWNVSTTTTYYSEPNGVLVDPTLSYVYVADAYNFRIDQFDYNTGALLNTYSTSPTTILEASCVAVFGSTVYVTSSAGGYVTAVAQNGSQVGTFFLSTVPNHDPVAIATDSSGFIYIADASYSQVDKLSPAGVIVQVFNTSDPPLNLENSYTMALAPNGDVYLSDAGNGRIVHFAADGTVLLTFNISAVERFFPEGLALLPNDQLAAVDGSGARVFIFAEDGTVVTSFNYTAAWSPEGVAVGTSTVGLTQIFVADGEGMQVVVFSTSGQVLRTLSSSTVPLQFPTGVALSTSGDLYVADSQVNRVLVFRNAVNAPSAVLGDPQFVGLRGQSFQVHGIDGAVYALVSSPSTQVNARFVFLSAGQCPSLAVIATACWSHPGSYLGAVSVQELVAGYDTQQLVVESGARDVGFVSVTLNGHPLATGDSTSAGHFSVHVVSSHRLVVRTVELQLTLDNSDGFINQQVEALVELHSMTAHATHGLLGQTHSVRHQSKGSIKHVEGEVDDYVVSGLLEHDFPYDRFGQ